MRDEQITEIKAVMYDLLAEEIVLTTASKSEYFECDLSDAMPMINHNTRILEALRENE